MTIQLDGTVVATTMRTPGNDYELAAGFCFTEGLLAGAPGDRRALLRRRRRPSATRVQRRHRRDRRRAPAPTPRLGTTSSSCGWCGSDQLDELLRPPGPAAGRSRRSRSTCWPRCRGRVLDGQGLFAATGAVHAAAAFDRDGKVVADPRGRRPPQRRRQGRRRAAARRRPAGDAAAACSSAAGRQVEMVQKAWAAGFGTLVAVSAPTVARRRTPPAGPDLTLAGFVRGDGFNVYAPERAATADRTRR